ncbi:MAG: acetyl-CoA hydrolase/transferase family protein [Thermanaeromonas sp.]|uniref:acetyl-CoA hydrolase/transferase family protein n=1 Tax=Thermanaeromonas sp. TaxID=2003697 RepID=UPI00243F95E5|nr:acetyl-CoA hydrolase/transferase family protein [Thermanaeromonas sp.]MCG0278655.1 acetyl-CoA hydrolase/transferase family protein [Thermanaeromonas sp.]
MEEPRVRCPELLKKVTSAAEAAELIKDGMTVGTSGFTPAGYPKAVPLALAERAKKERIKINLWTGASVGDELDGALARAGIINKRLPYQTNESIRDAINRREVQYIDIHLSQVAQQARYGFLGHLDVAIVEAVAITPEGYLIPSTSVGNTPTFVELAEKVIVEINTSQPLELEGMHDIYIPADPPKRKPIPLTRVDERIGTPYILCEPDKIAAIVFTDIPDNVRPLAPVDAISKQMAENLIEFFKREIKAGRLPDKLLPLQSGVGSVANAVLAGLAQSDFSDLEFYSEVIQDSVFDLIDAGKMRFVSGTSITASEAGLKRFYENIKSYRQKIILRPQEISNNPEVIRRLGIIAMNTAIEVDIYGNVNSTHIMGTRMMNGIGGSGDFSRSAYLSIFATPSTAKNGAISCIVPMVSHVDHTEHEVHVIVTEWGVADLRNKCPVERAQEIINNCAHPDYRPLLKEYLDKALKRGGHTPHCLEEALSWHIRFGAHGSMKPKN